MSSNSKTFKSGIIVGVLGSISVIGLGFAGQYAYHEYQTQRVLNSIENLKEEFLTQVNQQYLASSSQDEQQLVELFKQSSRIQREIVSNLEPQDGISLSFERLQLVASLQTHDNIPQELAQHKIYYQPQALTGQAISAWQCFSDLNDDLRPKDCLYRQEAPDTTDLLRQALLASILTSRHIGSTTKNTHTPPIQTECSKFKEKLPTDFTVFATGAYSGRDTNYQIDDSGHQATEMDIQVQHAKPVVLILGAYEPTVWNIKWEANTKIVGVVATGYHEQRVIGLPKSIPVLETSSKNSQCGYSYVSDKNASEINQLSQRILQKDIQAIVIAQNGRATIGTISAGASLQSSQDRTMKDVIDPSAPLAGKAGIEDAISKGLLRPATKADIVAWQTAHNKANNIHTPPVIGAEKSSGTGMDYVHFHNAYVVLKELTIPAGLYGAHSVTFFVPKGIPRPKGNRGHSTIYDMNSGGCFGSSPDCSHN